MANLGEERLLYSPETTRIGLLAGIGSFAHIPNPIFITMTTKRLRVLDTKPLRTITKSGKRTLDLECAIDISGKVFLFIYEVIS